MSDKDLYYFEEELSWIRDEAGAFAERHPEAASALGVSRESIDDPETARLIESVCLLNSRLHQRLDDGYAEFTTDLLNVLYPDCLRNVPSYSMLKVDVADDAINKGIIPKNSEFELSDDAGVHCIYRTSKELNVYPVQLGELNIYSAPFEGIPLPKGSRARHMVEFVLNATDSSLTFKDMDYRKINLCIRCESSYTLKVYDILRHCLTDLCVEANGVTKYLGIDALKNEVFDMKNPVVPYSSSSWDGLSLLSEFFRFPDTFTTLSIDLSKIIDTLSCQSIKLRFFLSETDINIIRMLQKDSFSLFSVPVVNLHHHISSPITVDFMRDWVPVAISEDNTSYSLYSIERVSEISGATRKTVPELYDEHFDSRESTKRWTLKMIDHNGVSEGKLMLIDTGHGVATDGTYTVVTESLVTDGSQVSALNYARSKLSPMSAINIPGDFHLMRRPTMQTQTSMYGSSAWTLLAHMRFNAETVFGGKDSGKGIRELMKLSVRSGNIINQSCIDAIKNITTKHTVASIRIDGRICCVPGTAVTVTLNPEELKEGIYLFSEFLDHFLAFFVSVGSFVQLSVVLEGRDDVYVAFPPRVGAQEII